MTVAGHGPNIGHGYVKYVVIDQAGHELAPIVFPAQIARAGRAVHGALGTAQTVQAAGGRWWVGEAAQLAPAPLSALGQQRLSDPAFIPALLRGALDGLGHLNGAANGVCVTGLPASWAADGDLARQLGARLREAHPGYRNIRVIAEPLGLMYSQLLDTDGAITGDPALAGGRVGVVDLGHHTVDIAILRRGIPESAALDTYQLGTARPLREIRARLSAAFERELTLFETDLAVRAGSLRVADADLALPARWDHPLKDNAAAVVSRLRESWAGGAGLEVILVGGGGAELPHLGDAIAQAFPHAVIVEQPQTAIARGYARLARRLGLAMHAYQSDQPAPGRAAS